MQHTKIVYYVSRCFFTFALLLMASCTFSGKTEGPYDPPAVLNHLKQLNHSIPIYAINQDSKYNYLKPAIYYYDTVDTFGVVTYFVEDKNHLSVAKMRTDVLTPALDGAMVDSQDVSINWADNSHANTCEPKVGLFALDKIPNYTYQTCLTWRAGSHSFLIFSSLGLDETLELVNDLIETR